jgi:hypothetical protein
MSTPARGRIRNILVAVWALPTFAAAAAPETSYRLAGIIAAGSESFIAVIELPDGRQQLFRTGDALGNGKIREITSTGARIELAGRELLLSLRGNPRLVAEAQVEAAAPIDDNVDLEQNSRTQQLIFPDTVRMLTPMQRASQPQPGATPPAADTLREEINHILEVPASARIVAVDQVNVNTPQETIEALIRRLNQGGVTRLAVSGVGALETVYLTPIDEQ